MASGAEQSSGLVDWNRFISRIVPSGLALGEDEVTGSIFIQIKAADAKSTNEPIKSFVRI